MCISHFHGLGQYILPRRSDELAYDSLSATVRRVEVHFAAARQDRVFDEGGMLQAVLI